MLHFVDYAGKEKSKYFLSIRGLGAVSIDQPFPIVSKKLTPAKAQNLLNLIRGDDALRRYQNGYYDATKEVVHILMPADTVLKRKENPLRNFKTFNRKKSYFCEPHLESFPRWGFKIKAETDQPDQTNRTDQPPKTEFMRNRYNFTPTLYRNVQLPNDILERLRQNKAITIPSLDRISFTERLALQDVKNLPWLMFDIEKTKYEIERDSAKVDIVSMLLRENGTYKGLVGTTLDSIREVERNGIVYNIKRLQDEKELLEWTVFTIRDINPWVIVSYGKYDIEESLERSDENFGIDYANRNPVEKVHIEFLRKFLIKGREYFNLHALMRFYAAHLPDQKLDTILRYFSNIYRFEWEGKTHDYKQLALTSPKEAILYNIRDVEGLDKLLFSELSPIIEDTWAQVEAFNISLTDAVHNNNSTEKKRDLNYFIATGTHKDDGFGQELRLDARADYRAEEAKYKESLIRESLEGTATQFDHQIGIFNKVDMLYIPWSLYILNSLKFHRFSDTQPFFAWVAAQASNPIRQFGLLQWLNGLSLRPFIDHYFHRKFTSELNHTLTKKSLPQNLTAMLFEDNLPQLMDDLKFAKTQSKILATTRMHAKNPEKIEKLLENVGPDLMINIMERSLRLYQSYMGFSGMHGLRIEEFEEMLFYKLHRLSAYIAETDVINFWPDYIFATTPATLPVTFRATLPETLVDHPSILLPLRKNLSVISIGKGDLIYDDVGKIMGRRIKYNPSTGDYEDYIYGRKEKKTRTKKEQQITHIFLKSLLEFKVEEAFTNLNQDMASSEKELRAALFGNNSKEAKTGFLSGIILKLLPKQEDITEEILKFSEGKGNPKIAQLIPVRKETARQRVLF